jgi:uncharacterized membrane protein
MELCKYKHIFGEPNKGVHKYRFMGMAVVDWLLTIIIAAVITIIWSRRNRKVQWQKVTLYFVLVLIVLILLGVILHWLFCVDTTLNKYIGIN